MPAVVCFGGVPCMSLHVPAVPWKRGSKHARLYMLSENKQILYLGRPSNQRYSDGYFLAALPLAQRVLDHSQFKFCLGLFERLHILRIFPFL